MIVLRMRVRNFGVFLGQHELELAPESSGRPVILIGAMNGSGKTTLLEGLKLVLFGRRAIDVGRGAASYDEFLAASISRGADPAEGAALDLEFSFLVGGVESVFRVVRCWSVISGAAKETLEVYVDGVYDPILTDGWNEHVETILPLRLAPFFFFDGERLETLADATRARDFLSNAIEALLGLDIVDRLSEDLRLVERRVKEGVVEAPEDQGELTVLRGQNDLHEREVAHLIQRCGELQNAIDQARRLEGAARQNLQAVAADLPKRLAALSSERGALLARREDALSTLMKIAYGEGPLTLLLDCIEASAVASGPKRIDLELLASRDAQILVALKKKRLAADAIEKVHQVLDADRRDRAVESIHQSSDPTPLWEALQQGRYADEAAQATIATLERCENDLDRVEAQLAALPTRQTLEPLEAALAERTKAVVFCEAEHAVVKDALERARRQRSSTEESIQAVIGNALERAKQRRYVSQLTGRSAVFRKTLDAFRERMAARHAMRLGDTILEAFQCLHRKTGTVERVSVDSRSFDMVLYDGEGVRMDASRLSAGERQLLAVAMVWAILKATGRPLPLWIDTPLGRLDSVHRRHLVERFFPFAAPQVVLLSTDTEIDARAEELLRPFVSRSYRLEFNPETRTSVCEEGYFVERAA